ncbi:hypothetical protein LOTGIDRAFT_201350 [Lottia gigantea]|uniref:Uncharacterized protein n=1 Tax=Lottia gigantea TaxID=225164 RepID=V4AVM7_LOTGI|nr:hypothetical protein LOTGIDRAFT_201350 [Lottia gigantea]ESO99120.1 hypothetical protein LOTGIDRAFT_201350 [Lottia gigantea]
MVIENSVRYIVDLINKYVPEDVHKLLPESPLSQALLIGTATGLLAYLIFRKRYKLPPGPFALPIVGSPIFWSTKNIGIAFRELTKTYGPVFTVYLGPQRTVVLNDINSVNEALLKKGAHFSNRRQFYSIHRVLNNSEDIIFDNYGTAWKLRRKLASRAIRLFVTSNSFNQKIEEAVSKTLEAMLKEPREFDPKPYMFYVVLNIIAGMCFGKSYAYGDPEYLDLLNNLEANNAVQNDGLIFENIFSWFAGIYKTKRCRTQEDLMEKFLSHVGGYVEEHKANFQPGKITDFTDSLLQAQLDIAAEGKDDMSHLKPVHINLIIFDIFIAGNDTSRNTLIWTLMFIIGTDGVQNKIQTEVDKAIGKLRFPTTHDRNNLPYTDAVLHESMRLGPVAATGVPHSTSCDTTLGKYDIPKDTMIMINHYSLHTNPDNWSDVDKFKPERFLDDDGTMAPKPDNWLPFSAGRRVCAGESLAKPELHLILASLFHRLEFSPAPGTTINMTPDLSPVTMAPKPFKVVVKKRF